MVVIVDNASWATNLRYAIPDIIKTLRTQPEFKGLQSIHYHISRYSMPPTASPQQKNSTDMQNARMLKELAAEKEKSK